MDDRKQTTPHNPPWWTEKHTSTWDRVKSAIERDWEQTKSDFSKTGGRDLNQNAADTVKQSMGSEPVPPLNVQTRPTDPKFTAKEAEKAHWDMENESSNAAATISKAHDGIAREQRQLDKKVGDLRTDLAIDQAKANEKMADARIKAGSKIEEAKDKAGVSIAKGQAKIDDAGAKRDEAMAKWHDAELEVRYGYSVRSRYSADQVWDDKHEAELQREWDTLGTGVSWSQSRMGVQRGWNYAGKQI